MIGDDISVLDGLAYGYVLYYKYTNIQCKCTPGLESFSEFFLEHLLLLLFFLLHVMYQECHKHFIHLLIS